MISKIIYMCHKELKYIAYYSENWKKLNPEYEIKLYDDNLCKIFLLNKFGQLFVDIFNFIKDGPIKADFWRCCILYKYGGFYVDADIEPLVPIDSFLENDINFISCLSDNLANSNFNPHFIGCHKDNEFLKDCIDIYIYYFINNINYTYWSWSITKIFDNIFINKYCMNELKNRNEGIYNINNYKIKFLKEIFPFKKTHNDSYCSYNKIRLFNNRQKNYDPWKHEYINNNNNFILINITHNIDLIKENEYNHNITKIFKIKK